MNREKILRRGVSLIASVVIATQLCGCGMETLEKLGVRTKSSTGYTIHAGQFQLDESYAGMTIEEADPEVISWLCATHATQSGINGLDLTIIGGMERDSDNLYFIAGGLEAGWGITDRQSALETINKLLQDGKVESSWNTSRAMQLLAQSYCLGYMEFDEYMEYAIPLGKIIQEYYSDWETFGNEYLEGYANWMRKRPNPDEEQIAERQMIHKNFVDRANSFGNGPYGVDFMLDLSKRK